MTLKHWQRAEQRARSASIVAMPVCWPGAIGCSD
jgi:hypothetical protein